jgi:ankyrin repeat protein
MFIFSLDRIEWNLSPTHKDIVLHKATYSKQANLVLRLLEDLPPRHLNKMICQNEAGNTILHEAATLDQKNSVDVATKMLEKAPELLTMTNKLGETALFRAVRYSKTEIFNFLADKISEHLDEAS